MMLKMIKAKVKKNKHKGFSLIELIIVVGLIVIVLAGLFSLLFFTNNVFRKNTNLSQLQSEIRLVSDFIMKEVRNASEVSLTTPVSPDLYYKIYVDMNGHAIDYLPPAGTVINKTGPIFTNPSTDVQFTLVQVGSKYMLQYTLHGFLHDSEYSINSKIKLNNIRTAVSTSNAQVIYFKKETINSIIPTPTTTPTSAPTTSPTSVPSTTPLPEIMLSSTNILDATNGRSIVFNTVLISTNVPLGNPDAITVSLSSDESFVTLTKTTGLSNNKHYLFYVIFNNNTADITKQVDLLYKTNLAQCVVQITDPTSP